jgi:cysteine synthase A
LAEWQPDALVVGVSTAGQLSGLSRYFRRFYPNVTIVGVDVSGSIIFNTPPHPYKMTGIGLSFVPPNYNPKQLDVAYMINDRLAFSFCRALAKSEGLLLGASTGAVVAAGLAFAAHAPEKKKILMINPDHGNRYLETVFNDEWIENQGLSLLKESELDDAISVLEPVPAPVLYGTNTP